MKPQINSLTAVAIVLMGALLCTLPFGHLLYGSEKGYRFLDMLSAGDQVALDAQAEGTYLIVAPTENYWRESSKQRGRFQRGVVSDISDDFVSIQLIYKLTVDPLAPQGMTRVVHLPTHAVAGIITFTPK